MFKAMSLKVKILSGFLTVCFGVGVVAVTGFYSLTEVVDTYDKLAAISVPNMGHISGLRARGRQSHSEGLKLTLFWDKPEETKKILESLKKATGRYDAITQEYLAVPFLPGEEAIFKKIDQQWLLIKDALNKLVVIFHSEDPEKANKMKSLLMSIDEYAQTHQSYLLELDDFHVATGEGWAKDSKEISLKMKNLLILIAIVTLFMGLGIAYLLSKSINAILQDVAERLKRTSDRVAASSSQVSEASQNLSEGTTQQAEALHETVSSTNEIAAMTQKTSDNSRESLKKAELSQQASSKGQHSLDEMLRAINEIGHSNQNINEQIRKGNLEIQEIVGLILEIGEKTKLIDDIVFQTKLLSFNVSVEAARAGEHGKGFAVVAQEMSNLADMSGKASKEISNMLTKTTQKARSVVEGNKENVDRLMSSGNEKIQMGTQVARNCKTALDEIILYVEEMCIMIRETSLSSQEQARGVSEINQAMGQIDTVTSQNAHASRECSEAAAYLMSEVENTRRVIHDLLEVINGESNATASSAASEIQHEVPEKHKFAA